MLPARRSPSAGAWEPMPDSAFVAVDLGGTQLRAGLGTESRGIVHRVTARTDHSEGPDSVLRQVAAMAEAVLSDTDTRHADIRRLAIAAPGPLRPDRGVVYDAPNMPGWHEVAIVRELERLTGIPVVAVNDANAAALGEHTFGAGRGYRHVVYLTVSTGIGGGVIVNDQLLEGWHGTAGELGHMTIDRNGPECVCGNVGCLEALASGTSIARRFRERRMAGEPSLLPPGAGAAEISAAASAGDPLAADVFQGAAEDLGHGVVNAIHIFSPEIVIIGGGVSQAGIALFEPVRAVVAARAMAIPRQDVRIEPAALGDNAGLFGALARAMNE